MNPSIVIDILFAVAILAWFAYRQSTWRAISPERAWFVPALLVLAGAAQLAQTTTSGLDAAAVGLLVVEIAVSAAVGAVIGVLAHIRPVSEEALAGAARRRGGALPAYEVRNGAVGLVLWVALVAGRVAVAAWAAPAVVTGAAAFGSVLLVLGVNRLARTAVVAARAPRVLAGTAVTAA